MTHNDCVTQRLSAVDAQLLWLSRVVPNDQFLLYAFSGSPESPDDAVAQLRRRAQSTPELGRVVVDDSRWRYPRWVDAEVTDEQFRLDRPGDWQACLDAVARLGSGRLRTDRMTWRAHVFPDVNGIPGVAGVCSVVVVQISHALGDGIRSAALAAALLGRSGRVRPIGPPVGGSLPLKAIAAARAHRRMVRDTEAGLLAAPRGPRPALSVNARPGAARAIRTVVVVREHLTGPTVTVAALTAVSEALGGYLRARGEDVAQLAAEVPMALGTPDPHAHNNFGNVGIGLYPDVARAERAARIAAELNGCRRRSEHPAARAAAEAFAVVPAPVLRWGIGRFDPAERSATVTGHTVVSSVNRGRADLSFGGCPVVLTAGFPALSPMMSLTHGVHGIGAAVAVSVHADPERIDVDDYADRLAAALGVPGPRRKCAQSGQPGEITP